MPRQPSVFAKLIAAVLVILMVSFIAFGGLDFFRRGLIAEGGQPVLSTSDPAIRFLTEVTVAILREKAGTVDICTGVIVSPTSIMTSARCAEGATKLGILFVGTVTNSDIDRFRDVQKTNVERVSFHPWYKGSQDTGQYGFARLALASSIPEDRRPVRYEGAFVVTEGDQLLAAAFPSMSWPASSKADADRGNSLRYAFASTSFDSDSWFLKDETGSCWHNTGGPLFLVRKTGAQLVGIYQDGDCGAAASFSSLTNDAVLRWLRQESD